MSSSHSLINKKEVIFHNSFCEASVLQPKPDKNITKKENYNNINLLYFILILKYNKIFS